jgi:hypothetical protein
LPTLLIASIGSIRGNCRRGFAIIAATNTLPRVHIAQIIAAATISFITARKLRSAAVISAAAIVIGAGCCAVIREGSPQSAALIRR